MVNVKYKLNTNIVSELVESKHGPDLSRGPDFGHVCARESDSSSTYQRKFHASATATH